MEHTGHILSTLPFRLRPLIYKSLLILVNCCDMRASQREHKYESKPNLSLHWGGCQVDRISGLWSAVAVCVIRLVLIIGSGSPGPLQFPLDTSLGSPPPLTGHWIGLNTPVQKASFLVCRLCWTMPSQVPQLTFKSVQVEEPD